MTWFRRREERPNMPTLADFTMRVNGQHTLTIERIYVTDGRIHFVGVINTGAALPHNAHHIELVAANGAIGATWDTMFAWPAHSRAHVDLPVSMHWDGLLMEPGLFATTPLPPHTGA